MVALDCGVSESLMSAIVNGNRNPKPKTWRGIIKKLGQSELLGISEMELFSWRAVDDYPEIEEVIKRGLGSKLSKTVRNKGLNE